MQPPPVVLRSRSTIERKADAVSAENKRNGDQVAAFVKSKFPGVKVQKVNPFTGYVTVDLSGADGRAKRMLMDGGSDNGYFMYDEPGKPVILQVTGAPQGKSKGRK